MGEPFSPINELYYVKQEEGKRDLIISFGNTQALTTVGQYELVGKILDLAQEYGCKLVISIGGFKKDEAPSQYLACIHSNRLRHNAGGLRFGHKSDGWTCFWNSRLIHRTGENQDEEGFSLLVDTPGMDPDVNAARCALTMFEKYLNIQVDLSKLEDSGIEIKKTLESFGITRDITEEKKKEEQQLPLVYLRFNIFIHKRLIYFLNSIAANMNLQDSNAFLSLVLLCP